MSIALNFSDSAELRRCFDALATDGVVIQALIDAPWGGLFGALRDSFGVSWMFAGGTSAR